MLTTSRKPPREVMRLLDFTPLGCGTGAGAWASAGMASVMKARPAARTVAKTLRFMNTSLEWTARSPPLLDCCSRDARDELVEEQVVDDGHRHPDQQPAR